MLAQGISETKIEGIVGIRWDRCGTEQASEYAFFYGKRNENYELGTKFFFVFFVLLCVGFFSSSLQVFVLGAKVFPRLCNRLQYSKTVRWKTDFSQLITFSSYFLYSFLSLTRSFPPSLCPPCSSSPFFF
jgi:hypothetical protein